MERPTTRYIYWDEEVTKIIKDWLAMWRSGRRIEKEAKANGVNFNRVWISRYKAGLWANEEKEELDNIHRWSDRATLKSFADQEWFDVDDVSLSWIKWKVGDVGVSALVKNVKTGRDLFELLDDAIKNHSFDKIKLPDLEPVKKSLMVTLTDEHVGLDPNPDWGWLFQYDYNGEIYHTALEQVAQAIRQESENNGQFDNLYLNDLWDKLDGWNWYTTRGWHELDQNMDNVSAFEYYIDGRLKLIRSILEWGYANKIIVTDVVNDNHSGQFWEIANVAVEKIIKAVYWEDTIEFRRLRRFIEHFEYWEHTFLLTHGKDKSNMRSGLPLHLNDKTINFIRQYLDHYDIKNKHIHLMKWDLHQLWYNACSVFDYRNYMAFSPPSPRVQHNFGAGYAWFSLDVIPEEWGGIKHQDQFIDYTKK